MIQLWHRCCGDPLLLSDVLATFDAGGELLIKLLGFHRGATLLGQRLDDYDEFIRALGDTNLGTGAYLLRRFGPYTVYADLTAFDRICGKPPSFEKPRRPEPPIKTNGFNIGFGHTIHGGVTDGCVP